MILYHITQKLLQEPSFTPRIPKNRIQGEDDSIERVCVSDSIEGCLSSMPRGGKNLHETIDATNGVYRLFRINTEKLGIEEENILTPETLYNRNLVIDSILTGEYWITSPFKVPNEDVLYIHISDFSLGAYSIPDPEISKKAEILGMDPCEYIDKHKLYDKEYSFTVIEDAVVEDAIYPLSPLKFLLYDECKKVNNLIESLDLKAKISKDKDSGTIEVDFEGNQNITSFLLYISVLSKIEDSDFENIAHDMSA